MGVHGITSLLHKEGWIPSDQDSESSPNLWKEWNPSMAFLNQGMSLEPIKAGSTFLIDGNGLAFHLFKVAYTRHLRSIFITQKNQSCPTVNNLSEAEITKALPCMFPLRLLDDITKEFVSKLRLYDIRCQIFWDGPNRRFKTVTDEKRRRQREEKFSNLKQFCINGFLPKETNVCQFLDYFPGPSTFLKCVKSSLQREPIEMIDCQEEADVELARRASGDSACFVLGKDSDFFFFKDIQYIPFDCIYLSHSSMHAYVCTRSQLASLIGLQDAQMVEFAILLGNDYINSKHSKNMRKMKDPLAIARYLQEQDDDFLVQANDTEEGAIRFVRALYSLQGLDAFPLTEISKLDHKSPHSNETIDNDISSILKNGIVSLPRDFGSQVGVSAQDISLEVTIQRGLASYVNQSDNDILREVHLSAYRKVSPQNTEFPSLEGRPRWEDVVAAFVIEASISRILKNSKDSLLVRMAEPGGLFDHYQFHSVLQSILLLEPEVSVAQRGDGEDLEDVETDDVISVERPRLPIDDHEDTILKSIENNQVTIIHGETGCGKSSRVPIMLLEAPSPDESLPEVKFFISQPRRIAAKGLVERIRQCEPEHRRKFALRMGHGWVEYETKNTQAWCVTTGYLTRLLANHPERFDDCTHLIIDEVHERSVDTDILCLLCRRLMERNKKIRLVLMSATLATKLYKEYFSVPSDPIHVGVRRFPIQQYFVEDLNQFHLPPHEAKAALAIQHECEQKRCSSAPNQAELSKRFSLAARLAKIVGRPGSSVLIFVPGMNEIVAITECIDSFHVSGINYTCCPIHSEIPFEDQMDAFNEPASDEVKIIIATNAAESSVTLPNVDHVICLGLCRQIVYNPISHRQMLSPCWISRASAAQRAGRTGRVRPGNVYRLYTRQAFESFMDEFDPGEIQRIPLDSIILMLKQMLHEEVVPVLQQCIEPPCIDTIGRSFKSLHRSSFIVEPNDHADITSLGSFVSSLGIDLSLGSLIGLGIQFGVAAEAVEMASIMSFPKSPFQISNPLFHDPSQFNEITSESYVSKCHFDSNLYSEPMAIMNALWDYHMAPSKIKWSLQYRIAIARMRQLVASRNSLRKRVADYFGINEELLVVESPPAHMPHAKVAILRLLQVWVFSDTLIECSPSKIHIEANGAVALSLQKGKPQKIDRHHLDQVLKKERHPYELQTIADLDQSGHFAVDSLFELKSFMPVFQTRLVSYMIETRIDLACCYNEEDFFLLVNDIQRDGDVLHMLLRLLNGEAEKSTIYASSDPNMKRRGVFERKCGTWQILEDSVPGPSPNATQKQVQKWHLSYLQGESYFDLIDQMNDALNAGDIKAAMFCYFPLVKGKKKKKKQTAGSANQSFSFVSRGQCQAVSKFDLQDLLGTSEISSITRGDNDTKIRFLPLSNRPVPFKGAGKELLATSHVTEISSWNRPLFQDIPEGARLLSVLVSGQRRGGQRLRFSKGGNNAEDTLDITLVKEQTDITRRWTRFGTDSPVFVQQDTVPASATCSATLFACSSNALEIKGGTLKVEGLTLLPTNPLFLLLSLLSFGLQPNVAMTWGQLGGNSDGRENDKKKARNAISWLKDYKASNAYASDPHPSEVNERERIDMAIAFHNSCAEIGEALTCFPDKIKALCSLFTWVDGYEVAIWDSLNERAFTPANLKRWQYERKTKYKEERARLRKTTTEVPDSNSSPITVKANDPMRGTVSSVEKVEQKQSVETKKSKLKKMETFTEKVQRDSIQWFATSLESDQKLAASEFPSANILALLVQMYCDKEIPNDLSIHPTKRTVALNADNWEIFSYKNAKGKLFYQAHFINDIIPILSLTGRGKNKLPKWMKKHMRPNSLAQVQLCVPPGIQCPQGKIFHLSNDRPSLLYDNIHSAILMESAFWLERQFGVVRKGKTRHWYQHNLQEMLALLKRHVAEE